MPLVPAAPPHQVQIISHFDFMSLDAERRRVYAAHTGSKALLVVNADSGAVVGQVETGGVQGDAVNPENGHVYTGDGESESVSDVDPSSMSVVRSVDLGAPIDAVAYDPKTGRIFADEDSGTQVFVVDAKSFKLVKSVLTGGHDLEFLAVDSNRPNVYQNVPDKNEFIVINTQTLKVTKVVPTPEATDGHPLQFDQALDEVIVGGHNGVVSVYTVDGKKVSQNKMPANVDQCDLDQGTQVMACAGRGKLWTIRLSKDAPPQVLSVLNVGHNAHTVAVDPKTHLIWTVWAGPNGDYVQSFKETK